MFNLPLIMASITICDKVEEEEEPPQQERRKSLRRRSLPSFSVPPIRSSSRLKVKTEISEEELKMIYTNKTYSRPQCSNLETIFEEPHHRKNGTLTFTGCAKMKRWIEFVDEDSNSRLKTNKIKKRKERVKKLLRKKTLWQGSKLSPDAVRLKLMSLDDSYSASNCDSFHSGSSVCASNLEASVTCDKSMDTCLLAQANLPLAPVFANDTQGYNVNSGGADVIEEEKKESAVTLSPVIESDSMQMSDSGSETAPSLSEDLLSPSRVNDHFNVAFIEHIVES